MSVIRLQENASTVDTTLMEATANIANLHTWATLQVERRTTAPWINQTLRSIANIVILVARLRDAKDSVSASALWKDTVVINAEKARLT